MFSNMRFPPPHFKQWTCRCVAPLPPDKWSLPVPVQRLQSFCVFTSTASPASLLIPQNGPKTSFIFSATLKSRPKDFKRKTLDHNAAIFNKPSVQPVTEEEEEVYDPEAIVEEVGVEVEVEVEMDVQRSGQQRRIWQVTEEL